MAINPYFGDFRNEQKLLDDLTIETIKATGRDVYYIPREYVKLDRLFGEDILSQFKYAYPIEMYVQDIFKFDGQRDVITKFGIDITDRLTLQVSITRFSQEVTARHPELNKPREGDLVYFPLSKHLFEINYIEDEVPFYQHGTLTTYTLTCEAFTYSNETIDTGNSDIDLIEEERKMFLTKVTLGSANTGITGFRRGDIVYQVAGVTSGSYSNKTYVATVTDYIQGLNNYLYLSDETGVLLSGASTQTIIRKDGLVNYYIQNIESTNINITKDPKILESSGDNAQLDILQNNDDLFDFSEIDPFSEGKY
jgi:hypothetical protein